MNPVLQPLHSCATTRVRAGSSTPAAAAATARREFSQLYEASWSSSVRLVRRTITDSDLAQDLVQEGFLRLHTHWHRIPGHARMKWLRRVLKNLCTDQLRRRQHQPTVYRAWEPGTDDTPGATEAVLTVHPHEQPDQVAAQREQVAAIHQLFDDLPTGLGTALRLSMDPEHDHVTSASILGCAVKTVSTRIYRARRYVAGYLARRAG